MIELSIAILIIGIMIAGITTASKMMTKAKITTAQAQTKSSPVSSIKNLVSWYEATSQASFSSSVDYNDSSNNSIATWYDINPQTIIGNNATQTVSGSRPTLVLSDVHGLPVVRFKNANNSYFNLPDGTIPYANSSYSIFIVCKSVSGLTGNSDLLGSGTYLVTNYSNGFRYYSATKVENYWWGNDLRSNTLSTEQLSGFALLLFQYDNASPARRIYVNGALNTSDGAGGVANSSTASANTIGAARVSSESFDGDIAEIIIFNRALNTEEMTSIQKYLGTKWQIKLQL